ncbi:uncharacterized protein Dana_GF20381 [Drosophila ananassae]|uniref:Uncharacterized protein n=1 Tax=Drosophila ananassae TaxID=7217 RepID=B3MQ54_DROAN|nr:uncharacterized protein LOC6503089 [Drosophila ananassae]EDV44480.2 uncharacterized protein Dana_GF20381 [Drosophila ananassae]
MGKSPSVAILAMGLAFCAFCHFFDTCNADLVSDLRKGIESLSKAMEKYTAELTIKEKFVKLQEFIDIVDNGMLDYQGKAKDKLPQVRSLNTDARFTYQAYVASVFEWCISVNSASDIFINASNPSPSNKDVIWNTTMNTLNAGLEKTSKSQELLNNVQNKTAELKNLFHSILFDVTSDFGPDSFYGLQMIVGQILKRDFWWFNDKREEAIRDYFSALMNKLEDAYELVKDIDVALKEDNAKFNKFHQVTEGVNANKQLFLSDAVYLRATFIPDIRKLKDECTNYVN